MKAFAFILITALCGVTVVEPHGYLSNPLARTSMHKNPGEGNRPPYYYDDTSIDCFSPPRGNGDCARCGNSADMNAGGPYDKGDVMGTYSSGSVIEVTGNLTAIGPPWLPHRGYFEIDLCMSEEESDSCFQRLQILGGSEPVVNEERICVPSTDGPVVARVQLPPGFACNKCTLRWNYRTSYIPEADACFNPNDAQTFRNCANISIR